MARGSSQSQSSRCSNARPGAVTAGPPGSPVAIARMRRRHLGWRRRIRWWRKQCAQVLYRRRPRPQDQSYSCSRHEPCFIGFVTALQVFGKLYPHGSGPVA